jgi:hypothetical protein
MSAKAMLEKPVTPLSREQHEVLERMTRPGQELALRIRTELHKDAATSVLRHFRIGRWLDDAIKQEGRYGANFIPDLALVTRIFGGESVLYKLRRIAQVYDDDTFEALASRVTAAGDALSIGHWYELAKLESQKARQKLFERVIRESLSIRELRAVLEHEQHQLTYNRGKQGPKRPASPVGGLQQFQKRAESLLRTRDTFAAHVLQPLLELPADKVNQDLLLAVEASCAQAEKLAAEGRHYLDDLKKVRDRIAEVLQESGAVEEEEDETAGAGTAVAKPAAAAKPTAAAARKVTGRTPTKPPKTAAVKKTAAKKKPARKPTRRAGGGSAAGAGPEFSRPTPATI